MLFEQVKEYLKTICDHMCKNDTVRTNQNLKENTLCQMPDVPARCSNGSLLSPCSMAVDTSDECYADPGAYKKEITGI